MLGGMPVRRLQSGFIQAITNGIIKWNKELKEGAPLYLEKLGDNWSPNNWVRPVGTFKIL